MRLRSYLWVLMTTVSTLFGCVEEYDASTEVFESAIVVEATITNELRPQQITISRTFRLEDSGPTMESSATVKVIDNNNTVYAFQEVEAGVYRSEQPFAAQQGVAYHLEITTVDGRNYRSETSSFPVATEIDDLYVERNFNENGDEGVSIYVDTHEPTQTARFYRYEYEETYKIIAPVYAPFELRIENEDFPYHISDLTDLTPEETVAFFVTKHLRPEQEQICFNTVKSNEVLLLDAEDFVDHNIQGHLVRFINRDNYIMSHRYSILVRQHVQTLEAYLFYDTLRNFSGSESLFSQVQTGYIPGNVFSLSNSSEKVVGYFEVTSVDEKRVYFNYEDLFPGDILPPYYVPCDARFIPGLYKADQAGYIGYSPVQDRIRDNYQFYQDNLIGEELNTSFPYQMVLPACGDCTVLGQTEIPDFWVEE